MENFKAVIDFCNEDEKFLTFSKGDVLQVYKRDHPDWWMAKDLLTGRVGWVPRNGIVAEPTETPMPSGTARTCTALHDFQGSAANQLGFARGETFTIVQERGEWWDVRQTSNGKQGIIPKSYVSINEPPSIKASGSSSTMLPAASRGSTMDSAEKTEVFDWLHTSTKRDEATKMLRALPPGAFLMRKVASKADCYTLSVKPLQGTDVTHFKVERLANGTGGYSLDEHTQLPSLSELVAYYSREPINIATGRLRFACPPRKPTATAAAAAVPSQRGAAPPPPRPTTASVNPPLLDATSLPPPPSSSSSSSSSLRRSAPPPPTTQQQHQQQAAPPVPPTADLSSPISIASRLQHAATQLNLIPPTTTTATSTTAPPPPVRHSQPSFALSAPSYDPRAPIDIHDSVAQLIRDKTGCTILKAAYAAEALAHHLLQQLPLHTDALLSAFAAQVQSNTVVSAAATDGSLSADQQRLKVILEELHDCQNDSQQRNWSTYDDSAIIAEYLEELVTLLEQSDRLGCVSVLESRQFAFIHALISYYQMEARSPLRLLLLKVFGAILSVDGATFLPVLLNSTVVPNEIARDITSVTEQSTDQITAETRKRLLYSLVVASMLFGNPAQDGHESCPLSVFQVWNTELVERLLRVIYETQADDVSLCDNATSTLLALNLQFTPLSSTPNPLILALSSLSRPASAFAERILLLFNRNEEPVSNVTSSEPTGPVSTLKILCDIFSDAKSAELFYTNDRKVLWDVIIREINDLPQGSQTRLHYLRLLHLTLEHSRGVPHRPDDILRALNHLQAEDDTLLTDASTQDTQRETRDISQFLLDTFFDTNSLC